MYLDILITREKLFPSSDNVVNKGVTSSHSSNDSIIQTGD